MSENHEPTPDLHHDGIQEEDNRLPRWWLATLFIAIIFSFFYWQYFHVLKVGHGPMQEYLAEKEARDAAKGGEEVSDEALVALSHGSAVQAGAATFQSTCAACHGANAEGKIGPNLTDNFWLHGGRPSEIFTTVRDGYPLKGMPSWKTALGPTKVKEVTAYVLTLRGKNVPGKAPEGTEYKPGALGASAAPPAAPAGPSSAATHASEGVPTSVKMN